MKVFVDDEGNNVNESLPLRYKDELAQSILIELAKPVPQDDELDEWHEWTLKTSKSIKALTRYLWNDISNSNKEKAKGFFEYYINIKFQKFFIPEEGSFSYYPHGEHATLDGTGDFFIFKDIGALSGKKQAQLWGTAEENITDLGIQRTSGMEKADFSLITNNESVNSLRLYKTNPNYGDLTSGVYRIIYPKETQVLDIIDLTPRVKHWVNSTDQVMGNWVSKEDVIRELNSIVIDEVPIYKNDIPMEDINNLLMSNGKITVLGFDILQVPRYKIVYEYKSGSDQATK
jgi:hypothetical protein